MTTQNFAFSGILRVDTDKMADKKLSETVTVLDNDCHTIVDLKCDGLADYALVFNARKRTLTVRKTQPAVVAKSAIDTEFANMAGADDFTLDVETPESKFKTVCQERGYDADLSKRVREIIAQHGSSEAVKDRLNVLLKARKAKVMRASDWAVAQELTAK